MITVWTSTLHSLALLDFFLSPDSSICSSVAFQALENSDIVSVSTDFPVNSKREDP